MFTFDTVIQTEYGSFFKAFALPSDEKPTTGVAPGSKIEEMNPETGAVDTYRFNGTAWVKIDSNGTPAGGGSGSGGVLVVHAALTEIPMPEGHTGVWYGGYTGSLDKTAGEIYAAAQTMPIIVDVSFGGGDHTYSPLVVYHYPGGDEEAEQYGFITPRTANDPGLSFFASAADAYPSIPNES